MEGWETDVEVSMDAGNMEVNLVAVDTEVNLRSLYQAKMGTREARAERRQA